MLSNYLRQHLHTQWLLSSLPTGDMRGRKSGDCREKETKITAREEILILQQTNRLSEERKKKSPCSKGRWKQFQITEETNKRGLQLHLISMIPSPRENSQSYLMTSALVAHADVRLKNIFCIISTLTKTLWSHEPERDYPCCHLFYQDNEIEWTPVLWFCNPFGGCLSCARLQWAAYNELEWRDEGRTKWEGQNNEFSNAERRWGN